MRFLRVASTRRVIGLLVGAVAAVIALAVVAGAALGGGADAPAPKPLAQAIHDSLQAPKLDGVTAQVSFTSHLFDGMTTETSSALLKGGSGRLWAAPGKLRLELQSDNGDAQVVLNDRKGFVYDGPSDTAYTFAPGSSSKAAGGDTTGAEALPTIAEIQQRIAKAQEHATIGDAQPTVVGDQPAYRVRVTPKDSGGLVGGADLAWDAVRGVPLDVAIYPRGQTTPALELTVTGITYGPVDPSVFDLTPPAGAHIVDLGGGSDAGAATSPDHATAAPAFTAVDPASLGPRAHRETKPAGDGYVVLYGKGLDTIAVFEHQAKAADKPRLAAQGSGGQPLDLPTTSINGAKATAFGTSLGGIVTFERDGISYTVAGSQPLGVLEDAARGL